MKIQDDYLTVPRQLVLELRDTPLAIGIYFLVARLFLIHHRPIPLSRGDLRTIDPTLREGAIKRALDRLITNGWLIAHSGSKDAYVPAWGVSRQGTPYSWLIGERLGCPTWIETIRVERAIVDLFIGRFHPHIRNSYLESYFTRPLLGLADVGRYVAAVVVPGAIVSSDMLRRWGLIDEDGQAQPIPDDAVLLATASQRASISGFQLSAAGWRKLGLSYNSSARAESVAGTPLIFVPKEQIASLVGSPVGVPIGESIGCDRFHKRHNSAAERRITTLPDPSRSMQGNQGTPGIARESRDTPPNPPAQAGGGASVLEKKVEPGGPQVDTETVQLLQEFGVHDLRLACLPPAQVAQAIAYAKAEHLGPGWVVNMLRRHRDTGDPLPEARSQPGESIDIDAVMQQYGDLFRLGSDVSDPERASAGLDAAQDAPICQQLVGSSPVHPVPPADGQLAQDIAQDVPARGQFAGVSPARPVPPSGGRLVSGPLARSELVQRAPTRLSVAELGHELRSRLRLQVDRRYQRLVDGLVVRIDSAITVIHCASMADRVTLQDQFQGAIRYLCIELGLPAELRVTDMPPPTEPGPDTPTCPPGKVTFAA